MNYNDAIQFLYQLRLFGLKLGLENTLRLAEAVGRPQDNLRFIHVAGTNGKGSTCAMLESIYRAAGLRVGLFTSPHLVSFAERIQVNRNCIATGDVARLVEDMRSVINNFGEEDVCPTFFEIVTVMALKYFAEQRCDLVIWETGLGGRWDATNIVTPLASVITNVQLDHQQWLGNTLPEIAREKAGIIKGRVPVITSAEDAAVLQVIADTARERHAPLSIVTPDDAAKLRDEEIALTGRHQKMNAAVAARTVQILDKEIPVPDEALGRGLQEARWAGRWQVVERAGQTVILDGAHNPAGAVMLAETWRRELHGHGAALILGMMRDKDCRAICDILAPLARTIYLAPVGSDRSADPTALAEFCRQAHREAKVVICSSLEDTFFRVGNESWVVVAGSIYFIGEALERLGAMPPSQERALNEYGGTAEDAPIRAVTFDIGGTLIEPWPSVGAVYARVAQRHGVNVSPEIINERFTAAWQAKRDFRHRKSDWADLVDHTFAGLATAPPSTTFFQELYDAFADPSAWRVFDNVRPCLELLRRSGFKLAAISNWDERLRPLLKALELDVYFDTIVVSCEVAQPKPGPEIFHATARQLQINPRSILHIGDSRREDVEGARAAGFQALLLTRGGPTEEKGMIASLDELPAALGDNKSASADAQAQLISVNSVDRSGSSH